MKVVITFTFCCDNLCKSKLVALEKPGKLRNFFLVLCDHPVISNCNLDYVGQEACIVHMCTLLQIRWRGTRVIQMVTSSVPTA